MSDTRSNFLTAEYKIHHKDKMITKGDSGVTLGTGSIDRVFDNLPLSFLPISSTESKLFISNITKINNQDVEAFVGNMTQTEEKLKKNPQVLLDNIMKKTNPLHTQALIASLLQKARAQLFTEQGELRPEVLEFLKKVNKDFSTYPNLSPEKKQQIKNSLLFSLTHTYLTAVQKKYEATIKMDDLTQVKLFTYTSQVASAEINKQIQQENQKTKALEEFMNLCINAEGAKIRFRDIELKAAALIKDYQLKPERKSLFKKEFFSDQLLRLIGKEYPDVVHNVQEHWVKNVDQSVATRSDVALVILKTGQTVDDRLIEPELQKTEKNPAEPDETPKKIGLKI